LLLRVYRPPFSQMKMLCGLVMVRAVRQGDSLDVTK
jgi:hypothetical protein